MTAYICVTCGVQYPPSATRPPSCPVCDDFRQYVGLDGQQWTTLEDLRRDRRNRIDRLEPGVHSVHTDPKFAIAQRCLRVQSESGAVLWDCLSLLDDDTIQALGPVDAIAISHPHYYATMIEWSEVLGNAPILIHEDDRQWVVRPDPRVHFWSGETFPVNRDLTLIRTGGHFEGAQVLHWNRGALFTGDVIQVVPDRRWVSFMRSYPNYIPLPASAVRRIVDAIEPFAFDRLYGAWPKLEILSDAKAVVHRSAARYISALSEMSNL